VTNMEKQFKRWKHVLSGYQKPGEDIDKAKDRRADKRVLYLDLTTPAPDRDSGSLDAFNHMLLLREMNFQVTFIPVDNLAFMDDYTLDLQSKGIEVLYHPFISSVNDHLKDLGKRYDLIFLSRPQTAKMYLTPIRKYCPKAKVLFNTVDLHFLRMERQALLEKNKKILLAAKEMKELELDLIKKCDIASVVSSYEYDLLVKNKLKNKVVLLPYTRHIISKVKPFKFRRDIVFVGGFRHPPNIDAVKFFITEIMPIIRQKIPNVKFHVVGPDVPAELKLLEAKDIIFQGHIKDLTNFLDKFRVSVAPLRFGAGIKGKIGSSMSIGLPVVATSLAAEGMKLKDNFNILVGDNPKEFSAKLIKLYSDEKLWNRLSKNSLSYADKYWGVNTGFKNLSNILRKLDFSIKSSSFNLKVYN
jgi:glycosyltransferase involved in cell wall biosynthesis